MKKIFLMLTACLAVQWASATIVIKGTCSDCCVDLGTGGNVSINFHCNNTNEDCATVSSGGLSTVNCNCGAIHTINNTLGYSTAPYGSGGLTVTIWGTNGQPD